MSRRARGSGTGRFWVAFWLALFLAVAMAVVARQQAALGTARELGRLRTQRAALEARKAELDRRITTTSSVEVLLPKVARLGLGLPATRLGRRTLFRGDRVKGVQGETVGGLGLIEAAEPGGVARRFIERKELGLRLDVELQDAGIDRGGHLTARLPDAGKDNLLRRDPRFKSAVQLAAGNDIRAGAVFSEEAQDGEVGIGFHRIGDERVDAGKRLLEDTQVTAQGRRAVAIERRTDRFREAVEADVLRMEDAVLE